MGMNDTSGWSQVNTMQKARARIPLPILAGAGAVLFFVLLLVLVALWPVSSVPTGHRGVITVGGKIKGIENEGYVVLAPWEKLNVFQVRAEAADVKDAEGGTADQQPVHVGMTVRYQVNPAKVAEVFETFSKDGNMDSYVETATSEVFKSVTAEFTAPDLILKRPEVSKRIGDRLRAKIAPYHLTVLNVDMTKFNFSPDYMKAINEKVTEEQKKLAAQNKVLTIEAEQRAKIVTAEAERDAAKVKADGEAYAVKTAAEAAAESLRIQNAALRENKDVLELRKIEVERVKAERWNGALPSSIYSGAPIPFMPVK